MPDLNDILILAAYFVMNGGATPTKWSSVIACLMVIKINKNSPRIVLTLSDNFNHLHRYHSQYTCSYQQHQKKRLYSRGRGGSQFKLVLWLWVGLLCITHAYLVGSHQLSSQMSKTVGITEKIGLMDSVDKGPNLVDAGPCPEAGLVEGLALQRVGNFWKSGVKVGFRSPSILPYLFPQVQFRCTASISDPGLAQQSSPKHLSFKKRSPLYLWILPRRQLTKVTSKTSVRHRKIIKTTLSWLIPDLIWNPKS